MLHTPGPWKWFDYPDGRKLLAAEDRAVIHCPDAPIAIEQADATLIAAAPDLIEALRGLYDDISEYARINNLGGFNNHWMRAARAAIAKADGQQ